MMNCYESYRGKLYLYWIYERKSNHVSYIIYNLKTTVPISIIFSFFGFVSGPHNRIKIQKVMKKISGKNTID